MPPAAEAGGGPGPPRLSIPEIRDYQRINAELVELLDLGHPEIVLDGAEGQRLLAAGLRGDWSAVVRIEGPVGPEVAADLDAPGLIVYVRGDAADGAGRGLCDGALVIRGTAGDCVGFGQRGGTIYVWGDAGHRAGLLQMGGVLSISGGVGRLAGERQRGGSFRAIGIEDDPTAGRGRSGGSRQDLLRPMQLLGDPSGAGRRIMERLRSIDAP